MNFKTILEIPKKFFSHPMGRGMVAYGLTFPTGCLIQQYYDKKKLEDINWRKCIRYSFYGILVSAPMVYGWVNIGYKIWPKKNFLTTVQKALIEQVTFCPVAISLFFFTMGCFDNNFSLGKARQELQRKFWDSYKVAVCYWPIVQTINFTFIPYNNRIVFVSMCGLLWVMFLAFVDEHGSLFKPNSEKIDLIGREEFRKDSGAPTTPKIKETSV